MARKEKSVQISSAKFDLFIKKPQGNFLFFFSFFWKQTVEYSITVPGVQSEFDSQSTGGFIRWLELI